MSLNNSVGDFFASAVGLIDFLPLTFALDLSSSSPSELVSRYADLTSSLLADFSQLGGSRLELVATLLLGFGDGLPVGETSLEKPAEWLVGSSSDEVDEIASLMVDETMEDDGSTERNALITGAAETPVQNYLIESEKTEPPQEEVPLPSVQELYDGHGKPPLEADGPAILQEIAEWIAANAPVSPPEEVPQPPVRIDAASEPALALAVPEAAVVAVNLDTVSCQSATVDQSAASLTDEIVEAPTLDESALPQTTWQLWLTRGRALAACVLSVFLWQKHPATCRKQAVKMQRKPLP